jgi:hypothetical protein
VTKLKSSKKTVTNRNYIKGKVKSRLNAGNAGNAFYHSGLYFTFTSSISEPEDIQNNNFTLGLWSSVL